MYLKPFNLKKYSDILIMFSNLCIENRDVIIQDSLEKVCTTYGIYDDKLVLIYNVNHMSRKTYNWLYYSIGLERNLLNIHSKSSDGIIYLVAIFNIPVENSIKYMMRKKFGLEFIPSCELYDLCTYWNGYLDNLTKNPGRSRE